MISRGLKFGDIKIRIAIWLNAMIKLQKAVISLNKHERCTFKSGAAALDLLKASPAGRE